MSTAGAALRTTDLSMKMEITIVSQLADTIRTIFEEHLNESVHRFVKSHADMFSGYFRRSLQDQRLSSFFFSSAISAKRFSPLLPMYKPNDEPTHMSREFEPLNVTFHSLDASGRFLWQRVIVTAQEGKHHQLYAWRTSYDDLVLFT